MNEKIKSIVHQIKDYLIELHGAKIKQVIIYGSQIRGDTTKDSDIDVLVVIDKSLNPIEVRKQLGDLLLDILLEEEELVSVIIAPEPFFKDYNSPFLLNVKNEGLIA